MIFDLQRFDDPPSGTVGTGGTKPQNPNYPGTGGTGESTLFSRGNGTEFEPYLISTAADLQALATYVNNGNTCEGKNFKLTANIDLSTITNWTPIGTFSGTFDGNGKTISNAKIDANAKNCGLFGAIYGGTVKNLTLKDFNVTDQSYNYDVNTLGALVGKANNATIENITMSGINVKNTLTGSRVGGLVGYSNGSISIEYVIVSGTTIESISSDMIGGLVGRVGTATINNCYVVTKISGGSKVGAILGGHLGGNFEFDNNYYYSNIAAYGSIDKNYVNDTKKFYYPVQLVPLGQGESYNGTILKIGENSYGIPSDDNNIDIPKNKVEDVQTLITPTEKLGDYTFIYRNGTYIIDNTGDFLNFAAYAKNNNCEGLKFRQTANVDLSGKDFTTITGFKGTYDGGSKLIVSSSVIFSGSTGTISYAYCCGTNSNGFTRVYKLNVPENVTVSGAKKFNNKYYAQSGATITISDFTGAKLFLTMLLQVLKKTATITFWRKLETTRL